MYATVNPFNGLKLVKEKETRTGLSISGVKSATSINGGSVGVDIPLEVPPEFVYDFTHAGALYTEDDELCIQLSYGVGNKMTTAGTQRICPQVYFRSSVLFGMSIPKHVFYKARTDAKIQEMVDDKGTKFVILRIKLDDAFNDVLSRWGEKRHEKSRTNVETRVSWRRTQLREGYLTPERRAQYERAVKTVEELVPKHQAVKSELEQLRTELETARKQLTEALAAQSSAAVSTGTSKTVKVTRDKLKKLFIAHEDDDQLGLQVDFSGDTLVYKL